MTCPDKILEALQFRPGRAGHHQLFHVAAHRSGEIDEGCAFRCHRHAGHGDVTEPGDEIGDQLVAGDGDQRHMDLEGAALVFAVDRLFEGAGIFGIDAQLLALVDEIAGAAIGNQDADLAARLHGIEITEGRARQGQGQLIEIGGFGRRQSR